MPKTTAPNPLARYLAANEVSQGEFGRRIGAARGVVSRWCGGKRTPERRFALAIERETRGAIPAEAWDEPLPLPSRSARRTTTRAA